MAIIEDFLRDLDSRWDGRPSPKLRLQIIGSAALMMQAKYVRGTKDSDVLETAELSGPIQKKLRDLAGPGTELHARHRLYVDIVGMAVPFLPQIPSWHPL